MVLFLTDSVLDAEYGKVALSCSRNLGYPKIGVVVVVAVVVVVVAVVVVAVVVVVLLLSRASLLMQLTTTVHRQKGPELMSINTVSSRFSCL